MFKKLLSHKNSYAVIDADFLNSEKISLNATVL